MNRWLLRRHASEKNANHASLVSMPKKQQMITAPELLHDTRQVSQCTALALRFGLSKYFERAWLDQDNQLRAHYNLIYLQGVAKGSTGQRCSLNSCWAHRLNGHNTNLQSCTWLALHCSMAPWFAQG